MKYKLTALLVFIVSMALAIHYSIKSFILNEVFIYVCLGLAVISGSVLLILWLFGRNKS